MTLPRDKNRLLREFVETLVDAKNSDDVYAVCALIDGDDGRWLAVSRRDDRTAFGLPGGKVDPGETPEEALVREVWEETGLQVQNVRHVFTHVDVTNGKKVATFTCDAYGEPRSSSEGVVRFVDEEALVTGPFAEYNKTLFASLRGSR